MKLPLYLYAKPSLTANGPLVFVPKGEWKVESNHKDSDLEITLDDGINPIRTSILHDELHFISRGDIAQIVCKQLGTEPQVTIYIHKQ